MDPRRSSAPSLDYPPRDPYYVRRSSDAPPPSRPPPRPIPPSSMPSLSSGQGFYTVESLQGTTVVPPAQLAPPPRIVLAEPYPLAERALERLDRRPRRILPDDRAFAPSPHLEREHPRIMGRELELPPPRNFGPLVRDGPRMRPHPPPFMPDPRMQRFHPGREPLVGRERGPSAWAPSREVDRSWADRRMDLARDRGRPTQGPLAWALIVWRCSLVFSSFDKIVSVLIHLLPGTVFFILRWWDPATFPRHSAEDTGPWPAWPVVNSSSSLWLWSFFVPLLVYCIWQALYFLIVEGLRRQRLLNDPEVMTSYRELKRKAERANNIWWRLSGLLGDERRIIMYAVIQAVFTVATLALTVLLFKSYRLHIIFEIFKLSATVWNGGNYIFDVMPRKVVAKKKKEKNDSNPEANGSPHNAHIVRSESNELIETGKAYALDAAGEAPCFEGTALNDTNGQDVCALCRRPSEENFAESLVLLDSIKANVHKG